MWSSTYWPVDGTDPTNQVEVKPPFSGVPVADVTKCVTYSVAISVANSGRSGASVTVVPPAPIDSCAGTGPLQRPASRMFCGVTVAAATGALNCSVTTAAGDTLRALFAGKAPVTVNCARTEAAAQASTTMRAKRRFGIGSAWQMNAGSRRVEGA